MLFSYFRGLKTDVLGSDIMFDTNHIEDWDKKFYYTKKDGYRGLINLPDVIVDAFIQIINEIKPNFNKFNNYEYSELWHLTIIIYPFENKMNFTSSCKKEKTKPLKGVTYVDDISFTPKVKHYLNDLFDDGVIKYIDIVFYGRWDDGEVYEYYVNDIDARIDGETEENCWNIVNDVMRDFQGQWWNSENGFEGKITIFHNDKVVIEVKEFYEEYEDTDMNITIDLDRYE